jgi:hypothetical protein
MTAPDSAQEPGQIIVLPEPQVQVVHGRRAALRFRYGWTTRDGLNGENQSWTGRFAEASPLRRIWQDANAGARHALINGSVSYEICSKALPGTGNDTTPLV